MVYWSALRDIVYTLDITVDGTPECPEETGYSLANTVDGTPECPEGTGYSLTNS